MKLFRNFLKLKEARIIEHYYEDDELCIDCAQGGATRETKKRYVDELVEEIAHHGEHQAEK